MTILDGICAAVPLGSSAIPNGVNDSFMSSAHVRGAEFVEMTRRCCAQDRMPFMIRVCKLLALIDETAFPNPGSRALRLVRECSSEARRSFNAMLYLMAAQSTQLTEPLMEMYPSEEEIKMEYDKETFGNRCNKLTGETQCTILHLLAADTLSTDPKWIRWRQMACKVLITRTDPAIKDQTGRTAADHAAASKYEVIRNLFKQSHALLDQYRLQSMLPVHKSATCLVLLAKCLLSDKCVALKCIAKRYRQQFEIEIRSRLEQNLDGIVVGLVGSCWHSPASDPLVIRRGTSIWSYHHTGKTYDNSKDDDVYPWLREYPYVMVLDQGSMSAHEYALL